ncbi:MAG: hypothetical protein COW11_03235 [Candidatus Omnitrophica bacterium CG12_big_fil_rev_8_21_14_0_65_43_15]|uniref:Uncharacterized protein n=1 Tax=Candidatus Taenaricola geysiri TaxID=1974752 RepID=A0A2J0LF17_9BACT|nr:MAG: hypothetical protein COW11_03235 [Candidatus Omnitrophica bacterium CG12_big_fil_rev_8_21_14_0_65_43_15]PIW80269.1 MAG: hypothetical protein COZ98_03420 [Candidatus Omnitrophica bacterium CG_4_8_14_3_um_filter_43_15]PJC46501.1 MAG: hypothetical protein CO036_02475 [Candidatus Omnitrophica bacterium CG_4_9_14_0_2_um_filter_43_12]
MTTYKIYDLGCKVNQYESQIIRQQFASMGFSQANGNPADIYIINTCTVTSSADSDSRSLLRKAMRLNPGSRIIVTGCYVEKDADIIKRICPDAEILKKGELISSSCGLSGFTGHNRAFVKIQDGCDNFCSYCKVPMVRGAARNRDESEILNEAGRLAKAGFKEIVLCGICLGAYSDIVKLLDKIESVKGIARIRLSSIEPLNVSESLIKKIKSSEKICRHLHIPLQSGDDKILKRMNRKYTAGEFVDLIKRIRASIPEIAISTDVLLGFPSETDKEFKNTLNTIKAVKPMRIHAFGYSPRKGTAAFNMPGEPEAKEKSRRVKAVIDLAGELAESYANKFKDKTVSVLVETSRDKKTRMLTGYTDTYIKVLFDGADCLINKIVNVRINMISRSYVTGAINGN